MIRDRGSIKWTAMMLPEHVELLRKWAKEDHHKKKPELDEQRLEELNQLIHLSFHEKKELIFTYYQHHTFHQIKGYVIDINRLSGKLRILAENEKKELGLDVIVDIEEGERV